MVPGSREARQTYIFNLARVVETNHSSRRQKALQLGSQRDKRAPVCLSICLSVRLSAIRSLFVVRCPLSVVYARESLGKRVDMKMMEPAAENRPHPRHADIPFCRSRIDLDLFQFDRQIEALPLLLYSSFLPLLFTQAKAGGQRGVG